MKLDIRPFESHDYEALSAIANANFPEYSRTAEERRVNDEQRDPKHRFARWVGEIDGQVVGFGVHGQFTDMYHPRKFWIDVTVHPEYQRRGIGSQLYQEVIAGLEQFEPISYRVEVREDQQSAMRFVAQRGYREDFRVWESRLDASSFDPTPFRSYVDSLAARNIEIKTMGELASDPERDRKLYDLFVDVDADDPRPEPYTPWSWELFSEQILKNPNLLPAAYFVAIDAGEYVGMTSLWASQGNSDLYTGLTGVRRAYRRKGIALALKLRAVGYAQAHGGPVIKTWNESNNRAMLGINERLGFRKQPAWINFIKVVRHER